MQRPIFARPPGEIISTPDRAAFIAVLKAYGVPYTKWKSWRKRLKKLWKEVQDGDTVYTTGAVLGKPERLIRWIVTVSARVRTTCGSETFILYEWTLNLEGSQYEPRKYASSVSEKVRLNSDGGRLETNTQTLHRCLREEARIYVELETVEQSVIFEPYIRPQSIADRIGCRLLEVDYDDDGTPGLWTLNQVAHYHLELPANCHFSGFRKDKTTRYLLSWKTVHEPHYIEPIPVELVLVHDEHNEKK